MQGSANLSDLDEAPWVCGSTLDEGTVTNFLPGEAQDRLDRANESLVSTARERLAGRLGLVLDRLVDCEDLSRSAVGGWRPTDGGLQVARASIERAAAVRLDSGDLDVVMTSPEAVRSDPHELTEDTTLMSLLDAGWMLATTNPRGFDPPIAELCALVAAAFPGSRASFWYGARSALGPAAVVNEHARMLVQLGGARSVLVMGEDVEQQQLRVGVGEILVVPGKRSVSHLPLDLDTAHLELTLPLPEREDLDSERRRQLAMVDVVRRDDFESARRMTAELHDRGWPVRLIAPGGAHVVESVDGRVRVVIGGVELDLGPEGVDLVVALMTLDHRSPVELAQELATDVNRVLAACGALWDLQLLDAAPAEAPALRRNERLTQVASGDASHDAVVDRFIELIDGGAWRSAEPGEVQGAEALDVAVQPLVSAEAIEVVNAFVPTIYMLNGQYFNADVVGHQVEPTLLVRVRAGAQSRDEGSAPTLGNDLIAHSTRKITWVLSLVDADGGWPHLVAGSNATNPAVGWLNAWPSLRPWGLSPMSAGERLFVLGRLHGNAFR